MTTTTTNNSNNVNVFGYSEEECRALDKKGRIFTLAFGAASVRERLLRLAEVWSYVEHDDTLEEVDDVVERFVYRVPEDPVEMEGVYDQELTDRMVREAEAVYEVVERIKSQKLWRFIHSVKDNVFDFLLHLAVRGRTVEARKKGTALLYKSLFLLDPFSYALEVTDISWLPGKPDK